MFILKYILSILALFSTLLFISDIVVSISSGPFFVDEKTGTDPSMKHAAIRLILSIIMSLTWPLIFLL